ncbi:MAG TPA: amidohydrolase family protein [Actinomycetota bacterium]|nr:amidohydrolase family protein [Actinomycetota bacterium]
MTEKTALVGITLIDGTGREPTEGATIVTDGSTIAEVGPGSDVSLDPDTRVLDVSGATVMPGIIDAHCHLGGASFPDEDNWVLEPDTYQAIASVAQAGAMLRHGVTSVRDISVNGPHLRKATREGLIDGPRITPCWRGLSRRGGHGDAAGVSPEMVRTSHPWGIVADGPDEVRKAVREVIKNGGECIKVWATGGGLHENEPEDVQHYSFEELRIIVEEANYVRVPVAAHCECASAARDAARAGVWSIEHGEDLDEETIDLMARKGISLNPTLVLLRKWVELSAEFGGYYGKPYIPGGGELPKDKESLLELHHRRLSANLMAAKEAGVRIGVGSDAFCTGLTPFGQQTLDEVKALVAAGMSEMEAIVAATRSGSEILRIDDVAGTIETGKSADVVVLRENPLEDIARLSEPNMLMIVKEGRIVKDLLSGSMSDPAALRPPVEGPAPT